VLVEGSAVGPTLYYGAGAGAEPTASAVIADIVDLARDLGFGQVPRVAALGFESLREITVVPMADVRCSWYLRLEAEDRPGVLSEVASIFSRQGISIEALIQKAPAEGETLVPVIILTNETTQGYLDAAVTAIEALDTITDGVTRIRVETLDG
jgi:homoserine dehydrogenase